MAAYDRPGGAEGLGARGLGDAQGDAADQSSPQRAKASDDHRLEGEDELGRAEGGIERRTHPEERPGQRRDGQRDRGDHRVDPLGVDPHQLGGGRVVGGGAHHPPQLGAGEHQLKATEHEYGDREDHGAQGRDRDLARDLPAGGGQGAGAQRMGVGREDLKEQVPDHHREPEGGEHRGELAAAQAPVEHHVLEDVAGHRGAWEHDEQGGEGRDCDVLGGDQHHERAQQGQIAVSQVDDPHHAEHQREPAGEEGIEPAEQDALDDRVDPGHAAARPRPKYASVTCSRVSSSALPSRTTRPSSMQMTRPATRMARPRSCSTSRTVVPCAITVRSDS